MYRNNTLARRRPEGWVERRRYFRRLTATVPPETQPKDRAEEPEPARRN